MFGLVGGFDGEGVEVEAAAREFEFELMRTLGKADRDLARRFRPSLPIARLQGVAEVALLLIVHEDASLRRPRDHAGGDGVYVYRAWHSRRGDWL